MLTPVKVANAAKDGAKDAPKDKRSARCGKCFNCKSKVRGHVPPVPVAPLHSSLPGQPPG
jgi:hypothetical protein